MEPRGFITGLITEIAKQFSLPSLIDNFINFFQTNSILTFIIFAVVLFLLYKLVRLAFRIFLVVIAGLIFPFVMNFLFGWSIPITIGNLIFYATSAVTLYLLAVFLKGVGKVLAVVTSPLRKASERKRIEEEIEEDLKKKKD